MTRRPGCRARSGCAARRFHQALVKPSGGMRTALRGALWRGAAQQAGLPLHQGAQLHADGGQRACVAPVMLALAVPEHWTHLQLLACAAGRARIRWGWSPRPPATDSAGAELQRWADAAATGTLPVHAAFHICAGRASVRSTALLPSTQSQSMQQGRSSQFARKHCTGGLVPCSDPPDLLAGDTIACILKRGKAPRVCQPGGRGSTAPGCTVPSSTRCMRGSEGLCCTGLGRGNATGALTWRRLRSQRRLRV